MLITSCSSIIPLITPTALLHCKRKAYFFPSNPAPLASHIFLVFQSHHEFSSVTQSCLALCDPVDCSKPSFPLPHYQLTQTHIHWVSDAIQPSHPLSSPSPLPSIFPSIRVFSNESVLPIRWPKLLEFQLQHCLSNEHSGLISFRIDWLDLLTSFQSIPIIIPHTRQHCKTLTLFLESF